MSTKQIEQQDKVTLGQPQMGLSRRQAWHLADHIRKEIIKQGLGPGDRLPGEKSLIEQFGMARATVREGLAILEAQGLVSISSGRNGGVSVSAIPTDAITDGMASYLYFESASWTDLYQARLAIEPAVAVLSFDSIDDDGIKQMQDSITDCEQGLIGNISPRAHKLAEINFHAVIAQYCPNPILRLSALHLVRAMEDMVDSLLAVETSDAAKRIIQDHKEIMDAFLSRSRGEVEELVRKHIVDTKTELLNLVKDHGARSASKPTKL
ncbi:FadR/GntR family transcriptional regulator [Phyllobacterium zundukense]|uniref:HTH gntR-type domain-containing protein n=1 Tax=Phyllobacterium zundukense TaxID=1867719 RepID=A0A2N9VYH8_9HYPH|nr:FCD domain-containing protein [Phyllobacterium zundukense]ATU95135.1 hypothetical protein BLM14_25620 [Phyllobacterium zundukense]PIO44546.1 hypothetical protein B5P45_11750 [Phyllobacterium zundukense]